MDPETATRMDELRDFMFARVYLRPEGRPQQEEAIGVLRRLMDFHLAHPEVIPASYRDTDADLPTQAADYVAGMTDRFALAVHDGLFPEIATPLLSSDR